MIVLRMVVMEVQPYNASAWRVVLHAQHDESVVPRHRISDQDPYARIEITAETNRAKQHFQVGRKFKLTIEEPSAG